MPESTHDRIDRERKAVMPSEFTWADIQQFRDYYRGRHKSTITAAQKKLLESLTGNRFSDNLCRLIVNAVSNRTELLGWGVADDPAGTVQEALTHLFIRNQLADFGYEVGLATIRDGNHAVGLRWVASATADTRNQRGDGSLSRRSGRVILRREPWWNGKTGMFVAYDDDGRPAYAVREWFHALGDPPTQQRRRTIYFPGRIERYIAAGDGWRPFPLPGEPETGIVLWERPDGRPLGIPVVHFPNGSDDDTPYGASDLDGGVLGAQDQINDLQVDLSAAARMTAFQMYTATGVAVERDAQGNAKPLGVGPGRTLQTESADGRFGVLPAGDLSQLERTYNLKVQAISVMTDTPIHVITGNWPSGEALLKADMPLVQKVQRLIKAVGPSWTEVAHRSTELMNAFSDAELNEDALITATFSPAERRDEGALADIGLKKAQRLVEVERIQSRWALKEAGVPDEEIDQVIADRETARLGQAASFGALFDGGKLPG